MKFRRFSLLAVFALLAALPSLAMARGYGKYSGTVNTPFGTMNMKSPEYKMSGGNPFVYQQLMQEKMMMQQQMMMMKQQQQYMQQMQKQSKNKSGKAGAQQFQPANTMANYAPRRKKKRKGSIKAAKTATASAPSGATVTDSAKTSGTKP